MVALVGPSGAGKTTVTHLVARLYDVEAGAVRVGGHDVRDVTLESLHANLGVVTQEAHLFHDTVRAKLAEVDGIADITALAGFSVNLGLYTGWVSAATIANTAAAIADSAATIACSISAPEKPAVASPNAATSNAAPVE